jgi:hypothetical protein
VYNGSRLAHTANGEPMAWPAREGAAERGGIRVRYLGFQSGCGQASLATQWWRDAGSKAAATVIRVAADATTSGIRASLHR